MICIEKIKFFAKVIGISIQFGKIKQKWKTKDLEHTRLEFFGTDAGVSVDHTLTKGHWGDQRGLVPDAIVETSENKELEKVTHKKIFK